MIATLRNRNLTLLVTAQTITFTGNMVLFVGLPFYVYELTGSALATGALFMAEAVPPLALGSIAGVFADRWDRRRTRIASDLIRIVVLLPLLIVPVTGWVWLVYAVAVTQAAVVQFSGPATLAMIPRLVPPERLVQANSLNALASNIAMLVGSAMGGVLLAFGGLPVVVLVDAASFLASALLVVLIPSALGKPERAPDETGDAAGGAVRSVLSQLREGLLLVRRDRRLVALFSGSALVGIADGLIMAGIVVFVREVLDSGSMGFGWLLTARGLGGVIGGVMVAQIGGRVSERRMMPVAALGTAVLLAGLTNIHYLPVAMVLILLTGIPAMAWGVSVQTLLQRAVADAYRGRIFGVFTTVMSVASLLGMAGSASTLDAVGAVTIFNVAVACNLLAAVVMFVAFRRVPEPAGGAVELPQVEIEEPAPRSSL